MHRCKTCDGFPCQALSKSDAGTGVTGPGSHSCRPLFPAWSWNRARPAKVVTSLHYQATRMGTREGLAGYCAGTRGDATMTLVLPANKHSESPIPAAEAAVLNAAALTALGPNGKVIVDRTASLTNVLTDG